MLWGCYGKVVERLWVGCEDVAGMLRECRPTCKDLVDLLHGELSILSGEAHGRLELENVPVRPVSTQEDSLLLQPMHTQARVKG